MATEHLGLPVHGYRAQTNAAVDLVNESKALEEKVLRFLDRLASDGAAVNVDRRWLAIGRTNLELAFMAINRSVFQPERVKVLADDLDDSP